MYFWTICTLLPILWWRTRPLATIQHMQCTKIKKGIDLSIQTTGQHQSSVNEKPPQLKMYLWPTQQNHCWTSTYRIVQCDRNLKFLLEGVLAEPCWVKMFFPLEVWSALKVSKCIHSIDKQKWSTSIYNFLSALPHPWEPACICSQCTNVQYWWETKIAMQIKIRKLPRKYKRQPTYPSFAVKFFFVFLICICTWEEE